MNTFWFSKCFKKRYTPRVDHFLSKIYKNEFTAPTVDQIKLKMWLLTNIPNNTTSIISSSFITCTHNKRCQMYFLELQIHYSRSCQDCSNKWHLSQKKQGFLRLKCKHSPVRVIKVSSRIFTLFFSSCLQWHFNSLYRDK